MARSPRAQLLVVYVAATLLLLFTHVYHDVRIFPHDARDYWSQAHFDLTIDRTRGYLFPFFLAPFNLALQFAPSIALWIYRAVGSALCAAVLVLIVPKAFTLAFGGSLTPLRRLVPVAAIALLYPGVVIYPLSDLPALVLCWAGVLAALRLPGARSTAPAKGADGRRRVLALALLSGAAMAGAYNVRPIYFASGMLLLAALCVSSRLAGRGPGRRRAVAGFVLGAALVSLPQAINNQIAYDRFTADPSPHLSLFTFQLYAGLEVQRYETTADPDGRRAGVPYIDRSGRQIMQSAGLDPKAPEFSDYLGAIVQHPLEMLGIYGRHFVNGLDLRDGRAYIKRASATRDGLSFIGFAMLALAAWTLVASVHERPARHDRTRGHQAGIQTVPRILPLAVMLLPVALITPGAIETRFYLPLHLLAWCVVAFKLEPRALAAHARVHGLAVALAFLVGLAVFSAISTATMTQ